MLDQRLAEGGDPAAMVRLVRRARRAGAQPGGDALAWAGRAAEAGHPGGMLHYALLLEASADPDRGLADHWRRRAADAGLAEACHQLGSSLQRRSDDRAEAIRWLERAAAAGHVKAGLRLVLLLWATPGEGLPKQHVIDAGAAWYRRMLTPPTSRVLRHRSVLLGRLLDTAVREGFGAQLTAEDPLGRLAGPPYWTLRPAPDRRVVIDLVPYWKPDDWIDRQVDELIGGGWHVVVLQDAAEPYVPNDDRCTVIRIDADHPRPAATISEVHTVVGDERNG